MLRVTRWFGQRLQGLKEPELLPLLFYFAPQTSCPSLLPSMASITELFPPHLLIIKQPPFLFHSATATDPSHASQSRRH